MGHNVKSTYIGAFACGGLVLLVIFLLLLSKGNWFSSRLEYSLYFDTSVRGLSLGAPVMFRGVKIGTVSDIRLAYLNAEKEGEVSNSNWPIEVRIQIDPEVLVSRQNETLKDQLKKQFFGSGLWKKNATDSLIRNLVLKQGLQAQLKSLSMVTGKLFIEFNFFPVRGARELAEIQKNLDQMILPAHLSVFERMFLTAANKNFDDYLSNFYVAMDQLSAFVQSGKFKKILEDSANLVSDAKNTMHTSQITVGIISSQISGAVDRLNSILTSTEKEILSLGQDCRKHLDGLQTEVRSTTRKVGDAADASRKLVDSVQTQVDRSGDDLGVLIEKSRRSAELLETNLEESRRLLGSLQADAPLQKDLAEALKEMEKAAMAMKNLAELLQSRPEVLIRGK